MNKCLCGCGSDVKSQWVRGHHSRVNNISKRSDVKEKRRQKMQKWHDSGEWKPWNRGVSDERTKLNGTAVAKARGESWKTNSGNSLRKNRKTFSGKDHYNWKGGTSTLVNMLRNDYDFYKFWKYPILLRNQFKCQDCNQTGNLHVHHDKQLMCEIVKKHLSENKDDLTYERKKDIAHKIIQYHVDFNVSGISLCKSCHKKRHLKEKDDD